MDACEEMRWRLCCKLRGQEEREVDVFIESLDAVSMREDRAILLECSLSVSNVLKHHLRSPGTRVPSRTSSSMFLQGTHEQEPCVIDYAEKVLNLLQMPAVRGDGLSLTEAIQIARYKEGQFYDAHFDNKSEDCWRRAATLITYLSDLEEGGATFFPHGSSFAALHENGRPDCAPGLRIKPRRGCAIMFWSRREDGTEDQASLHAAEKVLKGEKWICSRWFRAPPSSRNPCHDDTDHALAPEP
ncbi:hypothetical protein WJX75_005993 [Coccomyxa subellipsoidea]|uniref:Fe2OG dioxygenase domain-containing protein n=1 Tax=Coccomyxa subellipsoidea TaxID=248742 RepID=A0ABR2YQ03_9CHLO